MLFRNFALVGEQYFLFNTKENAIESWGVRKHRRLSSRVVYRNHKKLRSKSRKKHLQGR